MNERLERLVTALESGPYEQGQYRLRQGNRFCVWGVACDLYDGSRWGRRNPFGDYPYDKSLVSPPDEVLNYYEVAHEDSIELASMNDDGFTFREIAAHIRREF